jgi:Chaperone of endosialidase
MKMTTKTMTTPPTKSIGRSPLRLGFTLITLALASLALGPPPNAFGVSPAPDGGYAGGNTAEGTSALLGLTTGTYNTAVGFFSLRTLTDGSFNTGLGAGTLLLNTADRNTATGAGALLSNGSGNSNTANGAFALFSNTDGIGNTAIGALTLFNNTEGDFNTAVGIGPLNHNTTGSSNTAVGGDALEFNTTGDGNTAVGQAALDFNTTGEQNTAVGVSALSSNTEGLHNTAIGFEALLNGTVGGGNTGLGWGALHSQTEAANNTSVGFIALTAATGSENTALGASAGFNLTDGDFNIDIGAEVVGVAGESNTIRIGNQGTQTATFIAGISGTAVVGDPVVVDANGQLGTAMSSARFKTQIKPMDDSSTAILALKPVTFRYKQEIDPKGIPQFGLVAEEVEKVNPDLVSRDRDGKPYTVRYEAVNAMLLNEFLKEHQKVEQLKKDFEVTNAEQQQEIKTLIATVKEQASQIQRVSAQLATASPSRGGLEVSKPSAQTVANR